MEINQENLFALAKGASILTTGGGLFLPEQIESLSKHQNISFALKSIDDFDDDDILITASEVGTADAKEMDKTNILPKMLVTWEKLTGQKIAGVYAPELGQESIIVDTAIGLNVPLVDFDVAGGRAVPFVDINSFAAVGVDFSLSPLVIASDQGDIIAVDTEMDIGKVENFLRPLVGLSQGGVIYFIGGAVKAGVIKKNNIQNSSLSQSICLGMVKDASEIEKILNPYMTLKGRVTQKKEIKKNGFNCFVADFICEDGKKCTLSILNEVLFIKDENGKNIVAPPDKILIIDEEKLSGNSSKELLDGKNVILYAVKADKIWQSERGQKIFSKDRFIDFFE